MIRRPFPLQQWIEDHRDQLKPPVGNAQVYHNTGDFIVMIVGGPNSRKDFHYNQSEELFYQLEGDITVRIVEDDKIVNIPVKAGEMFLLPGGVPHSPQRSAGTVGLVIERIRREGEIDGFLWFCENCGHKLYEQYMEVTDIVAQLPPVMNAFYQSLDNRTCEKCGTVMEPPVPVKTGSDSGA